jgi:hypothetical protein
MQETCHRCGGELPAGSGESPFCPHCGAPQLFLSLENQSVETGGESGTAIISAAGETTSAAPPPRPRQVEWQTAIRCALVVAGVDGVLNLLGERFPFAMAAGSLWTLSAAVITLGLYQRRSPSAWIDARVGARIGIAAGLLVAAATAIATAVAGLVSRFGLHENPLFIDQLAPVLAQLRANVAASATPDIVRFMSSPEFSAGFLLAGTGMSALFVLILSAMGGALGGLIRAKSRASI